MKRYATPLIFALGLLVGGAAATGIAIADQPHMWNALHALQTAQSELNAAQADKGGHRAQAMNLVSEAIVQVRAGINYAK